MRKRVMPIVVGMIFVLVVGMIALCTSLVQKYTPGKEVGDLQAYFNLNNPEDMAIILNGEKTDVLCRYVDGHAYLNYEYVQGNLNSRFYWDENENILRYTTPDDVISVDAGSKDYYITKEKVSEDYTIVLVDGYSMYLAVDFVQKYTNFEFAVHESPNRLLLTTEWGDITYHSLKKDTQIREKAGIKSPILAELKKNDQVTVVNTLENWSLVRTKEGLFGYLQNKFLGETTTETVSREFEEPVFSHLLKDEKINMAWHQVFSQEGNQRITKILEECKGINVISPTWFYLNDEEGNIKSLANIDYVNYCHRKGVEVWALINNLENVEVSAAQVLTHTSTRDNLTNQIMAAAIKYDLDGINLDFEAMDGNVVGDAYIQFIRELSIKCEKNGIVLSVDNYAISPSFYHRDEQAVYADYVVIMGYDEHTKGDPEGSVASIGFVTTAVEDCLEEVPAEQIILGMPFYTRVWECTPKNEELSESEMADEDYVPYEVSSVLAGMEDAEKRMQVNNAEKVWSEIDGQYYVEYKHEGKTYKIWLEDEASMELRLKLMKEKDLAGASFWKLGYQKNSIWDLIIKYIN